MKQIPQRVSGCVTHHVCDCREWQLQQAVARLSWIQEITAMSNLQPEEAVQLIKEMSEEFLHVRQTLLSHQEAK